MDITFATGKLEKEFNTHKLLVKRRGPRQAELIERRMFQLRAAQVLEDLRALPLGRCHELKGDRAGQLSLDLDHPYRLIIKPAQPALSRKPDGGLNWSKVTALVIVGVEDTHG